MPINMNGDATVIVGIREMKNEESGIRPTDGVRMRGTCIEVLDW
jgi:hypothetical protein